MLLVATGVVPQITSNEVVVCLHSPLFITSANSLIDLVSAKSSFLMMTFWLPDSATISLCAASALIISLQAMMTLAPVRHHCEALLALM